MVADRVESEVIQSTEFRLLDPICDITQGDGYRIFRSTSYPRFYGGNFVQIEATSCRNLLDWEQIWISRFPQEIYEHRRFVFDDNVEFDDLKSQAFSAGYNVDRTVMMYVPRATPSQTLGTEFEVRRVTTEADWDRLRRFSHQSSVEYGWGLDELTADHLFRKTRVVSDAIGIEWFYVARVEEEEMLSKLGIFRHRGICRLQEVTTAKNSQKLGLATGLVSFAIQYALHQKNARALALFADADSPASRMYARLGFVTAGAIATLEKHPETT